MVDFCKCLNIVFASYHQKSCKIAPSSWKFSLQDILHKFYTLRLFLGRARRRAAKVLAKTNTTTNASMFFKGSLIKSILHSTRIPNMTATKIYPFISFFSSFLFPNTMQPAKVLPAATMRARIGMYAWLKIPIIISRANAIHSMSAVPAAVTRARIYGLICEFPLCFFVFIFSFFGMVITPLLVQAYALK